MVVVNPTTPLAIYSEKVRNALMIFTLDITDVSMHKQM